MIPISKEKVEAICNEARPYFAIDLESGGRANGVFEDGSLYPSLLEVLVGRRFNWWKSFSLHLWIVKGVRGKYRYAFYLKHSDGFIMSQGCPRVSNSSFKKYGSTTQRKFIDWEYRKVLVEKIIPMEYY